MDLVEGEDLAVRLRRDGAIPSGEAARIGLDVARGLGAAHLRGIVHRDVKPGNILLARDGRAMITDFGIARLAMDAEATLPGTTLGSVQYFSPEQAQGAATSPASDVYGLGLVLYEALTGRRPWTGADQSALALARVGAAAPSPRDVQPDVPVALDGVVTRCLAPAPADRYPNGNALAAALEPLVPVRQTSARHGAAVRRRRAGRVPTLRRSAHRPVPRGRPRAGCSPSRSGGSPWSSPAPTTAGRPPRPPSQRHAPHARPRRRPLDRPNDRRPRRPPCSPPMSATRSSTWPAGSMAPAMRPPA